MNSEIMSSPIEPSEPEVVEEAEAVAEVAEIVTTENVVAEEAAAETPASTVKVSLAIPLLEPENLYPTPSMQEGLPFEIEFDLRLTGCELIQTAGRLLRLPQTAMASGQVLFHRFYYSKSFVRNSMEYYAMASIFLSSKIQECPRRIRDVMNVFHHIKQLRTGKVIKPMSIDQNYYDVKNQVIKAERRILKELGFCVHFKHPHKIIFIYLQAIECSQSELSQKAWNYMNDSLRTDIFLRYSSANIVCACIYLSARELKISLPQNPPWYRIFGADEDTIKAICVRILHLYSHKTRPQEELEKCVIECREKLDEDRRKAREAAATAAAAAIAASLTASAPAATPIASATLAGAGSSTASLSSITNSSQPTIAESKSNLSSTSASKKLEEVQLASNRVISNLRSVLASKSSSRTPPPLGKYPPNDYHQHHSHHHLHHNQPSSLIPSGHHLATYPMNGTNGGHHMARHSSFNYPPNYYPPGSYHPGHYDPYNPTYGHEQDYYANHENGHDISMKKIRSASSLLQPSSSSSSSRHYDESGHRHHSRHHSSGRSNSHSRRRHDDYDDELSHEKASSKSRSKTPSSRGDTRYKTRGSDDVDYENDKDGLAVKKRHRSNSSDSSYTSSSNNSAEQTHKSSRSRHHGKKKKSSHSHGSSSSSRRHGHGERSHRDRNDKDRDEEKSHHSSSSHRSSHHHKSSKSSHHRHHHHHRDSKRDDTTESHERRERSSSANASSNGIPVYIQ